MCIFWCGDRNTRSNIEYVVNQLKGAATLALGAPESPWTKGPWKVFHNDELSLPVAANYVDANPTAAGLRSQRWEF